MNLESSERVSIANIFVEMCQGLALELVLFTEMFSLECLQLYLLSKY